MSYFGYWISKDPVTKSELFCFFWQEGGGNDPNVFWLQRQVIMKMDLTERKQTRGDLVKPQLWNMHTIAFLHVTGCGLDIRVQGHFLKCAPRPPAAIPISFPPYPNKSCVSGKSAQPLVFLCRAQTCMQADSLVVSLSAYEAESTWAVTRQHETIDLPKNKKGHTTRLTQTFMSKQQESARGEALLHLQN